MTIAEDNKKTKDYIKNMAQTMGVDISKWDITKSFKSTGTKLETDKNKINKIFFGLVAAKNTPENVDKIASSISGEIVSTKDNPDTLAKNLKKLKEEQKKAKKLVDAAQKKINLIEKKIKNNFPIDLEEQLKKVLKIGFWTNPLIRQFNNKEGDCDCGDPQCPDGNITNKVSKFLFLETKNHVVVKGPEKSYDLGRFYVAFDLDKKMVDCKVLPLGKNTNNWGNVHHFVGDGDNMVCFGNAQRTAETLSKNKDFADFLSLLQNLLMSYGTGGFSSVEGIVEEGSTYNPPKLSSEMFFNKDVYDKKYSGDYGDGDGDYFWPPHPSQLKE